VSAQAVEAILARLLTQPRTRAAFLADPAGWLAAADLTDAEREALQAMDPGDLELAAHSFEKKRQPRR
jgi:hypothetical protein